VIRPADPLRDAAACAAIYAPYVVGAATSFEEAAPHAAAMGARIERTAATHPWLVAEDVSRRVLGYAYASQHRERAAYRWACDVAVYVASGAQRQGVGRALYAALFERLRAQRFHVACAGITLPNDASVALHQALGFEPVGVYRAIGFKAGAWRDVGWWQLRLQPGDDEASPPEPLPPQG
jgi:L-amino acid N-acyltransferase YncA